MSECATAAVAGHDARVGLDHGHVGHQVHGHVGVHLLVHVREARETVVFGVPGLEMIGELVIY